MQIVISNIKINVNKIINKDEVIILNKLISKEYKLDNNYSFIKISKKSLDARKKPELFYIYSVVIEVSDKDCKRLLRLNTINEYSPKKYCFPCNDLTVSEDNRPIIIGFGPAGMMAGLALAKAGLRPIIYERGPAVDDRIKCVEEFWKNGNLNLNGNIQFGEGGAGTFSDGKLQTGVKDKYGRIDYILNELVEHGANPDILYNSKPHIGTDILTNVVKNIRKHIIELGGEVNFNHCFIGCLHNDFTLTESVIETPRGTINKLSQNLILSIGHSARDTFIKLNSLGLHMKNKPFAVGFRAIHPQSLINNSQYGIDNANKDLPAADYKLTYTAKSGRGVYSFCMCPGGYVVNASSESCKTAINGMSNKARDGKFANSAIIVTIDESVYGNKLFDGMHFQEDLENKTFFAGNGQIPIMSYKDYSLDNEFISKDLNLTDGIKGRYIYGDIRNILPQELNNDIREAFPYFGRIIEGYDGNEAYIAAIETRTSSPVKMERDDDFMSNIKGIFPCGEGAGYAGGITSACLDGLKVAEKVALRYN